MKKVLGWIFIVMGCSGLVQFAMVFVAGMRNMIQTPPVMNLVLGIGFFAIGIWMVAPSSTSASKWLPGTAWRYDSARPATRARVSKWLPVRFGGVVAPLSFLILLGFVLSRLSEHFATRDNLKQIAVQAAVVAILACGQTAVIISGNIDLSVGAVMAFAGVAAAQAMNLYHVGMWTGVAIACASGLAWGIVSGLISAYGRIPSFIVTIGMM